MQNPTLKFTQSSFISEKLGYFSEQLGSSGAPTTIWNLIFFVEILHTFPSYQCLQNGVRDFFYFV